MFTIDFNTPIHVHFIGIGGISMSGLAKILLDRHFTVSGSDAHISDLTTELQQDGCIISYPQSADNITGDIDLVVYTAAIHPDNPELKAAVDAGITEINGFEYTIKDTKKLEDEANQKAINDAKNKASVLAKGFGVKIKKACSLKFTNSNNVSSYRLQSRMAKVATLAVANDENDSNTEYSPEKITISSDVYASFAIKD